MPERADAEGREGGEEGNTGNTVGLLGIASWVTNGSLPTGRNDRAKAVRSKAWIRDSSDVSGEADSTSGGGKAEIASERDDRDDGRRTSDAVETDEVCTDASDGVCGRIVANMPPWDMAKS